MIESQSRESALVDWLMSRKPHGDFLDVGIGDDMAVLRFGNRRILLSSDMLLDGVHFDTTQHAPADIGRKAIACSLSDCAAMAAVPRGATLSIAYTKGTSLADLQQLIEGADALAHEFAFDVSGGDTTAWDKPLAIDVAVVAEPAHSDRVVLRSDAQVGDDIYVTGRLGGSIFGRHITFKPRIVEAGCMVAALGDDLHAMIDVTDGLALDLHRVCKASNCGAQLNGDALVSVAAPECVTDAKGVEQMMIHHVLYDGEDFELLFTVARGCELPATVSATRIGRVTASGLALEDKSGHTHPIEPKGYLH